MDEPMSNLNFRLMSLAMSIRNFLRPRKPILDELGIKEGNTILDYGCGPGSYSVIASAMVGATGKVYSLDIHPLAMKKVSSIAASKKLTNIETILSDCATGLENDSVDIVLFHDIFHALSQPEAVLGEFYRVLKPGGFVSASDHHMNEAAITAGMTGAGLFKLARKGKRSYIFGKASR